MTQLAKVLSDTLSLVLANPDNQDVIEILLRSAKFCSDKIEVNPKKKLKISYK